MDLLKIYNENQEREKQKEELKLQEKINKLVSDVIQNKSEFISDNKKAFEELGIKYKRKKSDFMLIGFRSRYGDYYAPINKTNIKKLKDYLERNRL